MPLADYRGWIETDYILGTEANRIAIAESSDQIIKGQVVKVDFEPSRLKRLNRPK